MTAPIAARRRPWYPEESRMALRGRAVVRLRETRDHVPHHGDVAVGLQAPATRLDDGRVDRVIRRFSAGARVTRAFSAARHACLPGQRHLGFDDDEIEIGLSRTFRVEVTPEASIVNLVSELRALDAVELATPHYLVETPFAAAAPAPPAPSLDRRWPYQMVGAGEALEIEKGDPAVIVAVIDSGVDLAHPELRGRCRAGSDLVDLPGESVSRGVKLFGDYAHRDRTPQDEMGHGTACAGIVGALGVDLPPGLAGLAQLLPMRALAGALLADRPRPTALGGIPDLDAAVKLAIDLGARVLNLSFGTPASALRPDDPVPHVEVVRYALLRDCVLVAASGNSGDDEMYFPAALPGVIAVGAVGPDGAPARFTTRGEHVALCAPGVRIHGATVSGYAEHSGTSFAAPFVTAAAALLLAFAGRNGVAMSPFTIRDVLARAAAPFARGTNASGCGAGILHVPASLRAAEELVRTEDARQEA